MNTEKLKLFVFVKQERGETTIEASTSEFVTTYCSDISNIVSAPLCEMEIEVPSITSEEAQKVLSGAMLESLIEAREKHVEESAIKLKQLDQRIADLQCIEFKGDKDGK